LANHDKMAIHVHTYYVCFVCLNIYVNCPIELVDTQQPKEVDTN